MPLAIDLFCGLGGWTEGLLAEGYDVVGFDIERHRYPRRVERPESAKKNVGGPGSNGHGCGVQGMRDAHKAYEVLDGWQEYPAQLVIQNVLTLHGSQFRDAALIVASPPCQAYSYRAMPWKRAKALPPPSNELFDACFRIQREACEAAGRFIPLVVENVKGAQPWVGRAKWHYGSFYLWGDVPALMPSARVLKINGYSDPRRNGGKGAHLTSQRENDARRADHQKQPVWFNDDKLRATKCGGDWFGAGADCSLMRQMSSKSSARKAASAQIAKIPLELSSYIARVYRP